MQLKSINSTRLTDVRQKTFIVEKKDGGRTCRSKPCIVQSINSIQEFQRYLRLMEEDD
jgi:hypothetical protein